MSGDGEKAAVFRTTKVRAKLKGDRSWLQQRNDSQAEATDEKVRTKLKDDSSWLQQQSQPKAAAAATATAASAAEEKPWMAELRSCRQNGENGEASPAASPTRSAQPPAKPEAERTPTSGFLIRGIFTKLDSPASPSPPNTSGSTQVIKKPSETYKKIAPHTVKSSAESQESHLSEEQQRKRKEAASNVLKQSAARQRSYVLSAAKMFESQDAPEPPLDKNIQSFVATRVEIVDDESAGAASPAASAPQPKPRRIVNAASVDEELAAPKKEAAPEPVREAPPLVPVVEKDPFEGTKPGCTKVDTPLPELSLERVQPASAGTDGEDSRVSGQTDQALVNLAPEAPTLLPSAAAPAAAAPEILAPVSATPESPTPTPPLPEPTILESTAATVVFPESPAPASHTAESPTPTSPLPESPAPVAIESLLILKPLAPESPTPTPPVPEPQAAVPFGREVTEETELEPSLNPSSRDDTLAVLSDTLISFDTSSSSFKDDEPAPVEREASPEGKRAGGGRSEEAPAPELSNCVPVTEDLLAFTSGPEEPPVPVPPSPGRWSQDLLADFGGESGRTLDINDVIFISREAPGLNVEPEEEREGEAGGGTRSSTETVTTTTETLVIIDKGGRMDPEPWSSSVKTTVVQSSLADPFDPYPMGTTAPNSSADLLQPDSDISINRVSVAHVEKEDPGTSKSSTALEGLADDVIPIDTGTSRLSTRRSWARTWETGAAEQSQEAEAGDGDQKMFVMFERKSAENDSPWDRWTSPTVYNITTEEEEQEEEEEEEQQEEEEEEEQQEEEEERPEDAQTETVTAVTTIREIRSEPEPAMDQYGAYSRTLMEEDRRAQTPSPEAKKPFVYVKEYLNTTASSLHSTSGSDYSYSGPASSTCTYCGEPVGNDAKITIDHLNVNSHPHCFQCAVCRKPMGDLLDSMFIHGGKVNCESCYSRAFD